jgi:hypothetical protein
MTRPVGGTTPLQGQVQKLSDEAAASGFDVPPDMGSGDTAYYMKLMIEMQAESRRLQAISEILTAHHNAAKGAIQNIAR